MSQHNYLHPSHALHDLVSSALERSPYRQTQGVEFEIDDHNNVFLRGRVASYYLKQVVQESVRSIPGVQCVKNELQVMAYANQTRSNVPSSKPSAQMPSFVTSVLVTPR